MLFRRLDGLTPLADPEGRHLSVEDRERQYEKAAKKRIGKPRRPDLALLRVRLSSLTIRSNWQNPTSGGSA
jgi:hypothetical protein